VHPKNAWVWRPKFALFVRRITPPLIVHGVSVAIGKTRESRLIAHS
jgi:hypothetical protein